jgi:hypothetical protein
MNSARHHALANLMLETPENPKLPWFGNPLSNVVSSKPDTRIESPFMEPLTKRELLGEAKVTFKSPILARLLNRRSVILWEDITMIPLSWIPQAPDHVCKEGVLRYVSFTAMIEETFKISRVSEEMSRVPEREMRLGSEIAVR